MELALDRWVCVGQIGGGGMILMNGNQWISHE